MTVYYINQLLIFGLAFPLCIYKPGKLKAAVYLAITFGYMWFLASFRYGIGYDYQAYIDIFWRIKTSPDFLAALGMPQGGLWEVVKWLTTGEVGFNALTWLIAGVTGDSVVMYGIYSAIIFIPIALGIYWYVDRRDTWIAVWLYVSLTFFYSSMSFIRQNIAVGISFLAYRFLRERKALPYMLLVLLAASFHKTAIIMIPLYLISLIPLGKISAGVLAGTVALGYLLSSWVLDFITNYIFTVYKNSIYITRGFLPVFLIIPSVLLAACLSLFPIWKKRDKNAATLLYMTIFSWIFWLFLTKHFVVERLSHYSYVLALIAVPAALACLRPSPSDYEKLAQFNLPTEKNKRKTKEDLHAEKQLRGNISDHNKYYWSAIAALVIITWLYNEFGQHVNGFHSVFPYQSLLFQTAPK